MKRHVYRRKLPLLLVLLLCISFFSITAFAAESGTNADTVEIPISVKVEGETGTLDSDIPEETYTFKVEALNGGPTPKNGDVLTITGEGKSSFIFNVDQFDRVGEYQYKVTQDASALTGDNSKCHDRGHYDDSIYYVTVTVTNGANDKFDIVLHAYKNSPGGDKAEVEYTNTYSPVPYDSLTVKKTWTDNGQKRPTAIKVQLLDGTTVIDTVELTQSNWTHTWDKLDTYDEHSWSVKEVPVEGYNAEYSKVTNGTITIHNIGESKRHPFAPKTGDSMNAGLWLGLLLISGAGLAGCAQYLGRKKNS
ncbi:MAG: Cna B-type domain-containing protein [Eubacteriales bacterium]|nr:Cna B-type domain-containing protein [Eubacteriales bacterium]